MYISLRQGWEPGMDDREVSNDGRVHVFRQRKKDRFSGGVPQVRQYQPGGQDRPEFSWSKSGGFRGIVGNGDGMRREGQL